jgi:putative transposase
MRSWIKNGINSNFITLDIFDEDKVTLCQKIIDLENEVDNLKSNIKLMIDSKNILNFNTDWKRYPSKVKKETINLFNSATKTSPKSFSNIVGISLSRLNAWRKKLLKCDLKDHSSCPKSSPSKATEKEIKIIEKMSKDTNYSHFPISALAVHAMKEKIVYLSKTTWHRYIKKFKWREARVKKYKKNKVGIRASKVNEIWHIDISVIKLIDNTKVFIQSIIDNYSRYVVGWNVFTKVSGTNTKELLARSLKLTEHIPDVMSDSGVENINGEVGKLVEDNKIKHTIAQIDINYSNSMIEAFFRSMKNNYLYYEDLNTVKGLKNKIEFYVNEHNNRIPHSALNGATPWEIYSGSWNKEFEYKLKNILKEKQQRRIKESRRLVSCGQC